MPNQNNGFKPIERTLYPAIRDLLINLGFENVGQEFKINEEKQYVDIIFTYEGEIFLLEVKIGNSYSELLKGLVQIYGYSIKKNIKNQIVILFPEDVRQYIYSMDKLVKKVKFRSCKSLYLTKNWWDLVDLSIDESFNELKSRIDKKLSSAKKIKVVSTLLQEKIKVISNLISSHYKNIAQLENALTYLTKDQGLFLRLSSKKTKNQRLPKRVQGQIISLLAYIMINQILFYFLYSKKTKGKKVPIIEKIKNITDLNYYFQIIVDKVDFEPIFDIDAVSRIPNTKEIIDEINIVIEILNPLGVEEIKYDLYGRLIGKSMPRETRKVLSSYYTKEASSEILCQLSIDRWDEKILDSACGSGTILVSAYNKKLSLYEQFKGLKLTPKDKDLIHKEFIENQITGMDIMPFACHLTGLNLSAQNLNIDTHHLQISNENSLKYTNLPVEVIEAYGKLSNAIERIYDSQKKLYEFSNQKFETKRRIKQKPKTFLLQKPDIVLINPPFTNFKNLPDVFKKTFSKNEITNICSKEINLWGYFLGHTDLVLKNGGKVGAIIPHTFLRGKRTLKIRKFLLKNYSIDYLIRPPVNSCFSEDSGLDDMIIIAKKSPFESNHETKIVFIHKNINDMSSEDIIPLIKEIRTELSENIDTDDYSLKRVKQKTLYDYNNNLMPFFFSNKIYIQDYINSLVGKIFSNGFTQKLNYDLMEDGLQLRKEVKPKKSVITRKISEGRINKSRLYFTKDNDPNILKYYNKKNDTVDEIEKNSLIKTFRTPNGVDTYEITNKFDYHIPKKDIEKKASYLIIPNRFILIADNMFSIAFYSDDKITPLNQFTMYLCSTKKEAKVLCLYFNSIFFIIQIFRIAKRSLKEGRFANFIEIKQADLKEIYAPDFGQISRESMNNLVNYFNKIKNKKKMPIIKQFKDRIQERIDTDLLINDAFNFNFSKMDIEKMYDYIIEELT